MFPEVVITITGQQGIGKSTLAAVIARLLESHSIPATADGLAGGMFKPDAHDALDRLPDFTVRIVTKTP